VTLHPFCSPKAITPKAHNLIYARPQILGDIMYQYKGNYKTANIIPLNPNFPPSLGLGNHGVLSEMLSLPAVAIDCNTAQINVYTHPLAILSWLLSLSDSLVEMVSFETMRLFWRADSPSSALFFLPRPRFSLHTNARLP
jgi:hypothetical protein